jgi:hypothetical protein
MTPIDFILAALRTLLERAGVGCSTTEPHDCALFGSAVLALHRLRDEIGDVDLAVTPEAFAKLERQGWCVERGDGLPGHPPFLALRLGGHDVNAFQSWRADQPEIDIPLVIRRAVSVHMWPCAPLALVAHHKATSLVRAWQAGVDPHRKHTFDLANITARLAAVDSIVPVSVPSATIVHHPV